MYQETKRLLEQKQNPAIKNINEKLCELLNEARLLNSYNKQLYSGRGKASVVKSLSSKENGKKGGRPPKYICEARKRRAEIREKFMNDCLTPEEQKEDEDLMLKISMWEKEKKKAQLLR